MMGEELNAADIAERGLLGDRAYALIDSTDGKVASAKNPRKWPRLFDCRAALVDAPTAGGDVPAVRITLPDGTTISSTQPDGDQILSTSLERAVMLRTIERRDRERAEPAPPDQRASAAAEEYWPDMEGFDYRDTVTAFTLPEGTFFDAAVVHVLTTATIDRLRELYPRGRFEARRFRPNIVIETPSDVTGFAEDAWIGRTLLIGDTTRLSITRSCSRCVMTTLAQGDLPKDAGILRTAAQHNRVNVGVYASVLQGGRVRRGDAVRVE
jgi:uncharacterized protein YcbX